MRAVSLDLPRTLTSIHTVARSQRTKWLVGTLCLCSLLLAPDTAFAGVDTELTNLIKKILNWACSIAAMISVWGVVRAGQAFQGEDPHEAVPRLKRNLVGMAITFGAVGIVQYFKSAFTQQQF